jgi:hypothetical protein
LIEARMSGVRPASVHVCLLDSPLPRKSWLRAEKAIENGFAPVIDVMPEDVPELLDFRCLAGLTVHIIGGDNVRVLDVLDRITEFDPVRVVACRDHSPKCILDWSAATGLVELELP